MCLSCRVQFESLLHLEDHWENPRYYSHRLEHLSKLKRRRVPIRRKQEPATDSGSSHPVILESIPPSVISSVLDDFNMASQSPDIASSLLPCINQIDDTDLFSQSNDSNQNSDTSLLLD